MSRPAVRTRPRSLVQVAAEQALDAAQAELEAAGAELVDIIVIVDARRVPAGEDDRTVAAVGGPPTADYILSILLEHAHAAARAMGQELRVMMRARRTRRTPPRRARRA